MDVPFLNPVFFQIGPIAIHWYGLMYIVGMSCSVLIGRWIYNGPYWGMRPRPFPSREALFNDSIMCCFWGVIGGRVGNFLFYDLQTLFYDPLQVFQIWNGGMSIHGGLLFAILYIVYHSNYDPRKILRYVDFGSVCVPIALGFGRIGNFINGELYGYPTTLPWGMRFASGGPFYRHPSQLYEAILEGIVLQAWMLFCVIYWKGLQRKGFLSLNFFFGYFFARGFVDIFFRQPLSNELIWGIKKSYLLSIMLILLAVVFIVLDRWVTEREKPLSP